MTKGIWLVFAVLIGLSCRAEEDGLPELQKRIDETAANGGGIVEVPAGEHYLQGPIRLRSNIELKLHENARLVFSDNPEHYKPTVLSTWEGVECKMLSPLVYAYGCTNVAITGGGTFAPKMDFWRTWFKRGAGHMAATRKLYDWCSFQDVPPEARDVTELPESNVRPHLMQFNRCKNVRLDGFRIRESPFWTIHLFLSEDCVVRNLDVYAHGHNNDGIDIEMTKNVLVENCTFDQGDDAIVIKAGRNQDAWRLNVPSENIEVRNCRVKNGHVLLGIGSEMSGGVRNVYMHDCEMDGEVFNVFYVKVNERRGGFVENIRMKDCTVRTKDGGKRTKSVIGVQTDVLYQWKDFPTHEVRVTPIRNLTIENVHVTAAERMVCIRGDKRLPVDGVTIRNVTVDEVRKPDLVENAVNVTIENNEWRTARYEEPMEIGNYNVTVRLGDEKSATENFIKFNGRRLASDRIMTKPGEIVDYTFTARVPGPYTTRKGDASSNRTLTLEVFTQGSAPRELKPTITSAPEAKTIYLLGDSTVTDQKSEPWGSWGQILPAFLKEGWSCANFARSGLALRTCSGEGRLVRVLEHFKSGDWLIIQFGHNDQKIKGEEPENGYTARLNEYIDKIEAKGGRVVLVTPVERRRFDKNGKQEGRTLAGYADAVKAVAAKRNVPVIDLNDISYKMMGALGEQGSKALQCNNKGKIDNTHHNIYGAYVHARTIAAGLAAIPGIGAAIREPFRAAVNPQKPADNPNIPPSGTVDWTKPEGN